MARYVYSKSKVDNGLELLEEAKRKIANITNDINMDINTIKNARGFNYMSVDFSQIQSLESKAKSMINELEDIINKKVSAIKEDQQYESDHPILSSLRTNLATSAMSNLNLFQGILNGIASIGDAGNAVVGYTAGLFGNKMLQECCAEEIKDKKIDNWFSKQYKNGILSNIEKYSSYSSKSTGASIIKGVGSAAPFIAAAVFTGGASAAGSITANTALATDAALSGMSAMGDKVSNRLSKGDSFNKAVGKGTVAGTASAGLTFGLGKAAEKIASSLKNVKKETTPLLTKAEDTFTTDYPRLDTEKVKLIAKEEETVVSTTRTSFKNGITKLDDGKVVTTTYEPGITNSKEAFKNGVTKMDDGKVVMTTHEPDVISAENTFKPKGKVANEKVEKLKGTVEGDPIPQTSTKFSKDYDISVDTRSMSEKAASAVDKVKNAGKAVINGVKSPTGTKVAAAASAVGVVGTHTNIQDSDTDMGIRLNIDTPEAIDATASGKNANEVFTTYGPNKFKDDKEDKDDKNDSTSNKSSSSSDTKVSSNASNSSTNAVIEDNADVSDSSSSDIAEDAIDTNNMDIKENPDNTVVNDVSENNVTENIVDNSSSTSSDTAVVATLDNNGESNGQAQVYEGPTRVVGGNTQQVSTNTSYSHSSNNQNNYVSQNSNPVVETPEVNAEPTPVVDNNKVIKDTIGKKTITSISPEDTPTTNKDHSVLPIIGGIAGATAIGLGTKVVLDRRKNSMNEETDDYPEEEYDEDTTIEDGSEIISPSDVNYDESYDDLADSDEDDLVTF